MSDGDDEPWVDQCDLCGEELGTGREWVLLNRYGVGTSKSRCLTEVRLDGEYQWEMAEGHTEDQAASGALLCLDKCLVMWLQAKMAEADQRSAGSAES